MEATDILTQGERADFGFFCLPQLVLVIPFTTLVRLGMAVQCMPSNHQAGRGWDGVNGVLRSAVRHITNQVGLWPANPRLVGHLLIYIGT
jgi:hypothetical protein